MSALLHHLRARGMVAQVTHEGIAKALEQRLGRCSAYLGFDPTARSLHVGNLAAIMVLRAFQQHGVRPIALIGGATGAVGDPSGRSTERQLLSAAEVADNAAGIRDDLSRLLDFGDGGDAAAVPAALLVDNATWYSSMDVVSFLRDVGRHFRVGPMLGKESVRARMQAADGDAPGEGMSFTEFSYQVLQAHDFARLRAEHDCLVQIGGSDQWGNITAGCDLIRRTQDGADAFGITLPLLTTASGEKFGKSAGNAVWLSPDKTSHYDFYQHFLRVADADVHGLLTKLTELPLPEVDAAVAAHTEAPEKRGAQTLLAREVTALVRGADGLDAAERATAALFGGDDGQGLRRLSAGEIRELFPSSNRVELRRDEVTGRPVTEVAVKAQVCKSKGQCQKLVSAGGLYVNNKRVSGGGGGAQQQQQQQQAPHPQQVLSADDLIGDGDLLLFRSGKKNYTIVQVLS